MVFEGRGEKFRWTSLQNRSVDPPREYIDAKTGQTPFALSTPEGSHQWRLESATAKRVSAGGRPAAKLDLTLRQQTLRVQMHVLAFPGTAIVREWLVIENAGSNPCAIDPQFLQLNLRGEDASSFTHYWMVGGTSGADQGMLHESPISRRITA